tara:strand:- start:1448 stop:2443 length:996 start_codon:yes stop_codon:yes gene_type:complete
MNSFSFLGAEKVVVLHNQTEFSAEDMYSEWKEWVITDNNAKYEQAFDTTGGDDVGNNQEIAPYFFLRNNSGWRIKMPEQNGELIISGNLFPRDSSQPMFIQAENYDAFLRLEVSTRAVVVTVPAETGVLSPAQSAQLDKITAILEDTEELQRNQSRGLTLVEAITPKIVTISFLVDTDVADGTALAFSLAHADGINFDTIDDTVGSSDTIVNTLRSLSTSCGNSSLIQQTIKSSRSDPPTITLVFTDSAGDVTVSLVSNRDGYRADIVTTQEYSLEGVNYKPLATKDDLHEATLYDVATSSSALALETSVSDVSQDTAEIKSLTGLIPALL